MPCALIGILNIRLSLILECNFEGNISKIQINYINYCYLLFFYYLLIAIYLRICVIYNNFFREISK